MTTIADLRSTGRTPRVHGNGFVQFDLNPQGTRRLHVWHDDVPRQEVATPIHDHVFSLRSTVLCGKLVHEVLKPVPDDMFGSHLVYRATQQPGTQNTILVPDEGIVRLDIEQRLVLASGSIYTFPAFELHQTDHYGLTATVMDKINAPDEYGRPRVLVPVGSEPDNMFHRDAFDPEDLWPFIGAALTAAADRGFNEIGYWV